MVQNKCNPPCDTLQINVDELKVYLWKPFERETAHTSIFLMKYYSWLTENTSSTKLNAVQTPH